MAYQELSEYVATQIDRGVDAQVVRQTLMEAGWRTVDIDNALRDVASRSMPAVGVSVHDDLLRIRNAVNALEQRIGNLESRLAIAPEAGDVPGPTHADPSPHTSSRMRLYLGISLLVGLFAVLGYIGMQSAVSTKVASVGHILVALAVGLALVVPGFIFGRVGRRGTANLLTGAGLAFAALATISAWYVQFIGTGVAVSLGVLFVTGALVLGRFYDLWVHHSEPVVTSV